ncbi:hypothetical protein [Citreimonas salinaria]|nr:hypothetical protein [Citreimonas salinaria]
MGRKTKAARVVLVLGMGLALAGCGRFGLGWPGSGSSEILFEGQRFNATARAVERRDKQSFVVSVPGAVQSLRGPILAGDHAGKKHCIHFFGTSDIDWTVGPDTDPAALVIEGGALRFAGRCRD